MAGAAEEGGLAILSCSSSQRCVLEGDSCRSIRNRHAAHPRGACPIIEVSIMCNPEHSIRLFLFGVPGHFLMHPLSVGLHLASRFHNSPVHIGIFTEAHYDMA